MICEHPTAAVVGGETWQRCLNCQAMRERPAPPEGHGEWGAWASVDAMIEQFCRDLNQAHDELCKVQGLDPATHDWPEWTPQANSIRWAEKRLGRKLAKTNAWTLYPARYTVERNTEGYLVVDASGQPAAGPYRFEGDALHAIKLLSEPHGGGGGQ